MLNGDRGLSYAEEVPHGSKVVAGAWWPKDYAGEPLVSFEPDLPSEAGPQDRRHGHRQRARPQRDRAISNLREVKWESLAINFVMVFSPNTLEGAPHNLLVTITLPRTASLPTEAQVDRALGQGLPVHHRDPRERRSRRFTAVFAKVMTAVRVAGSVTLLAGALVLAGALATAQRRRILEAVILKTLGATRRRILTAHFARILLLAAVTALLRSCSGRPRPGLPSRSVWTSTSRFSAARWRGRWACRWGSCCCLAGSEPGRSSGASRCRTCGPSNITLGKLTSARSPADDIGTIYLCVGLRRISRCA